jgi:hypothetical protein
MSHEVTDLEPVFEFLSAMDSTKSELWEARYICLIWLSLICMIPFDLKKVDSGLQSQVRYICRSSMSHAYEYSVLIYNRIH